MADTIVTIKLSMRRANMVLDTLRAERDRAMKLGQGKDENGEQSSAGPRAHAAARTRAVELGHIIESIEGV